MSGDWISHGALQNVWDSLYNNQEFILMASPLLLEKKSLKILFSD